MYTSQAEADIRDYFNALNIGFKYKNYKELVIVSPNLIKSVEKQYKQIGNAYCGHNKNLIKDIEDLKKEVELKDEKHKNELEREIHKKELEIIKKYGFLSTTNHNDIVNIKTKRNK